MRLAPTLIAIGLAATSAGPSVAATTPQMQVRGSVTINSVLSDSAGTVNVSNREVVKITNTTKGLAGTTSQSATVAARGFGSIQVVCRSSHTNSDDPIVFPGEPGAAHQHDFFANTSTDAFSTDASLAGRPTTCSRPGDTAAYWTPTLLNNGRRVVPDRVIAYYRTSRIPDITSIRPFPRGLKMIAGSATATASNPQPTRITNWNCGDGVQGTAKVPASCPNAPLRLRVEFPNCWNGRNLDSADHKSHMAYAGANGARGCPASHPVAVPALSLNFRWKISGSLSGVRLSSGGVYTGHADFWNSWKQRVQARLVRDCLNAGRICTSKIADVPKP